MMFRFLAPLAFVALLVTACIDLSGEGSEPNTSGSLDTTEAGRAALLTGPLNPETCEEVLADPPSSYTLQLQALTASAQGGSPRLETMCAAIFQTSAADGSFLTMALIRFDSLDPAIARYNLLKAALIALDHPISEIDNANDDLLDWFAARIDSDGIGQTTVLRLNNWVLSISIGPTIAESTWNTDDLLLIGESIIRRAQ